MEPTPTVSLGRFLATVSWIVYFFTVLVSLTLHLVSLYSSTIISLCVFFFFASHSKPAQTALHNNKKCNILFLL